MGKQIKWSKSYSELAKFYNTSESALKVWAKRGINLDDASLVTPLVTEWKRTFGKKLDSARAAPRSPVVIDSNNRIDAQGSLERAQAVELATFNRYIESERNGDTSAVDYRKEWMDAADHRRKVENDTPAVNLANQNTYTREEVEQVLYEYLIELRINLESIPERVSKELPQEVGAIVLNSVREEINNYISDLFRCPLLKGNSDTV